MSVESTVANLQTEQADPATLDDIALLLHRLITDLNATRAELLTAAGVGTLLGISRAQAWKLHSSGKLPLPLYLGSKTPRWRVEELRAWIAAGAPCRQRWEQMKAEILSGRAAR